MDAAGVVDTDRVGDATFEIVATDPYGLRSLAVRRTIRVRCAHDDGPSSSAGVVTTVRAAAPSPAAATLRVAPYYNPAGGGDVRPSDDEATAPTMFRASPSEAAPDEFVVHGPVAPDLAQLSRRVLDERVLDATDNRVFLTRGVATVLDTTAIPGVRFVQGDDDAPFGTRRRVHTVQLPAGFGDVARDVECVLPSGDDIVARPGAEPVAPAPASCEIRDGARRPAAAAPDEPPAVGAAGRALFRASQRDAAVQTSLGRGWVQDGDDDDTFLYAGRDDDDDALAVAFLTVPGRTYGLRLGGDQSATADWEATVTAAGDAEVSVAFGAGFSTFVAAGPLTTACVWPSDTATEGAATFSLADLAWFDAGADELAVASRTEVPPPSRTRALGVGLVRDIRATMGVADYPTLAVGVYADALGPASPSVVVAGGRHRADGAAPARPRRPAPAWSCRARRPRSWTRARPLPGRPRPHVARSARGPSSGRRPACGLLRLLDEATPRLVRRRLCAAAKAALVLSPAPVLPPCASRSTSRCARRRARR